FGFRIVLSCLEPQEPIAFLRVYAATVIFYSCQTFCFRGCTGNIRIICPVFLFLQFDPLPWRIPDHNIESAMLKHCRKFQRPVEEVKLSSESSSSAFHLCIDMFAT